jgi:hypothetical protein
MAAITVRGHGTSSAQPDEVAVGLTEASRLATDAASLIDELGVQAARRTTSQIAVAEHGEHTSAGWQHRGYRARSRIGVRLEDAELASRVVSEAAERLEARIDGPTWRVAHDNLGHSEAHRRAAADARSKAEEYAAALGGRVGAIASVVEPGAAPSGPPHPRAYAVQQDVSGMPLEGGEHHVVAEIDVTFRLEQS